MRKPTIEYTAEDYATLMTTNLDSVYHLCQLSYSLLKASGNGSIVFISSVAGLTGTVSGTIYSASKGEFMLSFIVVFCSNISLKVKINIHIYINFDFPFLAAMN